MSQNGIAAKEGINGFTIDDLGTVYESLPRRFFAFSEDDE